MTTTPTAPRPWLAALLGLVGGGLGHLYAGRPRRALVAFAVPISGVALLMPLGFVAPGAPVRLALLVLAVVAPFVLVPWDAWHTARRTAPHVRRWWQRWWMLLPVWAIVVLWLQPTLYLLARTYLVEAFRIPSGAMAPTLVPGDYIFSSPWGLGAVQRGTVVIYKPAREQDAYIHRVVGLPGDTLAMEGYALRVNGRPVRWGPRPDSVAAARAPMRYGTWGPFVVPAGHYFMLGDALLDSYDGRYRGPTPVAEVMGRPRWIYFSRDTAGVTRWDRVGRLVR